MIQVDAVPASITREAYSALVAAAGFTVDDLVSLEFRSDGIYAEVYARDESGAVLFDRAQNETVRNRVFVPIRG